MSALYRLLGPLKPGEERLSHTATIPGATRKDITEAKCNELLDLIRNHLNGTPTIELVYGPKILRELVTGDGVDSIVITAMAIVRKLEAPSLIGRATVRSAHLDPNGMGFIAPGEYVPPPRPPEQVPNAGVGIPDQVRLTGDWAKPRPIGEAHLHVQSYEEMRAMQDEVEKLYQEFFFRAANQRNEALREMADKMLADGTMGIAMIQVSGNIEETGEDRYQMIDYTKMTLHPRVPFGTIFEFPSEDAYLKWMERTDP